MNTRAEAVLHNGKYVLNARLGQGIFGITYRATDTKSGKPVVLKTIADNLCHHPDFARFRERLLVGTQRLTRCQHPNLVRTLGCFEEAGRPYLVMNYVPGQTLAELLESGQTLPISQALYYIRQVGAALDIVHKNGLLHRDVRPQNIIQCQGTHKVVLADFGIACELTAGVMQTHSSLLSAGYAPIEKYLPSAKRTPATDVYALAATFYCLLTGRPPVPASVRDRIPLLDLRKFQPHLSPAIEQAILWGLEMAVEKRPQTVQAWLDLLPNETRSEQSERQQILTRLNSSIVTQPNRSVPHQSPQPRVVDNFLTQVHILSQKAHDYLPLQKALNLGGWIWDLRLTRIPASRITGDFWKKVGNKKRKPQRQANFNYKILPWRSLLMTSAIAASSGVGFGLALRYNRPVEPGSTFLHTEQSFPPRSNWPISDTPELTPSHPQLLPHNQQSFPPRSNWPISDTSQLTPSADSSVPITR